MLHIDGKKRKARSDLHSATGCCNIILNWIELVFLAKQSDSSKYTETVVLAVIHLTLVISSTLTGLVFMLQSDVQDFYREISYGHFCQSLFQFTVRNLLFGILEGK
jgi:hypothetical protein